MSASDPGLPPNRRVLDALAIALFAAVLSAMSWRLYEHRPLEGPETRERWALASYRDAIYYPVHAVHDGVNPYDVVRNDDPQRYMQRYPVADTLPLYSPLLLLVFAPFASLPLGASMVAFTAMNAALFVLLAWLTLRLIGRRPLVGSVFALAALLLASQPGQAAFNTGQVALPLALAMVGALQWGDCRGWSSAWLVAFSTLKPTYGGPLGLLLAARRDWRCGLGGLLLGGVIGAALLMIVFARSGDVSVGRIANVLGANQTDFNQDPTVIPKTNKARIDLVAAVEYLTDRSLPGWVGPVVAAAVLGLTGWTLWRTCRPSDMASAISAASALIILATFICIYHNVYDLLPLVVPIAACATVAHPSWKKMAPAGRWIVVMLLVLPFVNGLWTDEFHLLLERGGMRWGETTNSALSGAYRAVCAANGLGLTGAWAILVVSMARQRGTNLDGSSTSQLESVSNLTAATNC